MINPRVASLEKSSTLKITALTKKLKKEGKDVVNFAAGEPDFDTPDFAKKAAVKALDDGFTKYTPSAGTPDLRQAIADKLKQDNNIDCSADNVLVTTGAKYALFVALFGLISEGEEVLVPTPYWVSYPEMVKMTGGTLKVVQTKKENDFKMTAQELEAAISDKSKLLILNYPSNPTGTTYTKEELEKIYVVTKKHNLLVLSDEIYEELIYDGKKHVSFASLPGAFDTTITVNGFSKAFAMTGWRLGYVVAPDDIVKEISKIIDHTTSCSVSISQMAGLASLKEGKAWVKDACRKFEARRNLLWEGLKDCEKIKPIKSQGTFYMFCDVSKTNLSSFDFASKLLEGKLVSVIPGSAFGAEGYVRISFATSEDNIKKGIERIKEFLEEL